LLGIKHGQVQACGSWNHARSASHASRFGAWSDEITLFYMCVSLEEYYHFRIWKTDFFPPRIGSINLLSNIITRCHSIYNCRRFFFLQQLSSIFGFLQFLHYNFPLRFTRYRLIIFLAHLHIFKWGLQVGGALLHRFNDKNATCRWRKGGRRGWFACMQKKTKLMTSATCKHW
jgi:hypothetical protein